MKHCGTKGIETKRLTLRRFVSSDYLPMYNNWASDDAVTKFLTWQTHSSPDISRQITDMWVDGYKNDNNYQWAIAMKEAVDQPFGSIAVVSCNEDTFTFEIGYCIGKKYWRKGIMTEALSAVIDFLFENTDVNRIEAIHDVNNPNSGKVMKKCGMMFEGTLRKAFKNNTGICDVNYYSILRPEWKDKRED